MDDLQSNRIPLLRYIKPDALFQSRQYVWNWSNSPETLNWGQNLRFTAPYDLEIWQMTLKNHRAPLFCYYNRCASFHSHRTIRTGVRVRKRTIRVILYCATLKFDGWLWKTIGHLSNATSICVHHFIAIGESNWTYCPELAKLAFHVLKICWLYIYLWSCIVTLPLEYMLHMDI